MKLRDAIVRVVVLQGCFLALSCGLDRSGAAPTASQPPAATPPPEVQVARVISQKLNTSVRLPAQLTPYEIVDVYPKVTGFVKWIRVDRGSKVKAGEQIALLEAPEVVAQRAEAESIRGRGGGPG